MRNDLNTNERKALDAIIDTCDDLDGDMFTRLGIAMVAVVELFMDGHVAGGYVAQLIQKGYLEIEEDDYYGPGLWVKA